MSGVSSAEANDRLSLAHSTPLLHFGQSPEPPRRYTVNTMPEQSNSESLPEMKQDYDLTPEDFLRYPVWIGVHNYDYGQPWYEKADEQTFRPWTEPLPFAEKRGTPL